MKKNRFALFLSLNGVLAVTAIGHAAESHLIGYDASGTTTLTAAQYWSGGVSPTSTEVDVSETDFIIDNPVAFRMPSTYTTFKGRTLQFGSAEKDANGYFKEGNLFFENVGLVLVRGRIGNWRSGTASVVDGPVTVALAGKSTFRLDSSQSSTATAIHFNGPVSCAKAEDILLVGLDGSTATAYAAQFAGGLANFYGQIKVDVGATVYLTGETTSMPGTVDVAGGGTLSARMATDATDIGNLKLAEGACLSFEMGTGAGSAPVVSSFRVTKAFTSTATSPIKIGLNGTFPTEYDQDGRQLTLLSVPKGTGLRADAFCLPDMGLGTARNGFLPNAVLRVVEEGDEEKLCLLTRRIVQSNANDAGGESMLLPEFANHWNGHQVGDTFNPEWDYFVNSRTCRVPDLPNSNDVTFAGHSLTFFRGTVALKNLANVNLTNATSVAANWSHWGGTVLIDPNEPFARGGTTVVSGRIRMVSYEEGSTLMCSTFSADSARFIRVLAELCGDGRVDVMGAVGNDTAAYPYGAGPAYVQFAGLNTNFTGRLYVRTSTATNSEGVVLMPTPENRGTLIVTDGRNLGGPLTTFTYDALRLQGWATLWARGNVTLDAQNRGVNIVDCGQFEVDPNCTLTICEQMTLSGPMKKQGEGTLALGGTLAFTGPNTFEIPSGYKFPLEVCKGGVKVLTATAADGLELAFAPEGKLLVDRTATGEVAVYGLKNTRAGVPFAVMEPGNVISVVVENPGEEPVESEFSVPVCTVKVSDADTVESLLRVERPWSKWSASIQRRTVDEGTVTLVARFCRTGFAILIH